MNRPPPHIDSSPAMRRILAVLEQSGGLSRQEIARAAFVGAGTLSGGGYLALLRAARLIHVSGWSRNANGFTTPLYAIGGGTDFPQPLADPEHRHGPGGLARIAIALRERGPLTYKEAAIAAGLSPNTVKSGRYMDALAAQGLAHVCGWRRSRRGPACAVYAAGTNRDLPLAAASDEPAAARRPQPTAGILQRIFDGE